MGLNGPGLVSLPSGNHNYIQPMGWRAEAGPVDHPDIQIYTNIYLYYIIFYILYRTFYTISVLWCSLSHLKGQ